MKICFVGACNLAVLAPQYRQHQIGGESVQQTLLARALAQRGHQVTMVVQDYGQRDGAEWDGIRVYKTYRPSAGLPVLRFFHPRWTGMWSAMARADADLYYVSESGMHVGLAALFCKRHRRRYVFRTASDADCEPRRLMLKYARDRWLYEYGLRRADAILVQSAMQAEALSRHYGLTGRVARMMVEKAQPAPARDIDLLWVSNIRSLKRPERMLKLADDFPDASVHIAGGPMTGSEALFRDVMQAATLRRNVTFHGRLSYYDTGDLYGRARLFVNTSDIEGFPNAYLQAWARGVPVVTLIDPDAIIEREGLGIAVASPDGLRDAAHRLLHDPAAWRAASERCRSFVAREYGDDKVLSVYLDAFELALRAQSAAPDVPIAENPRNV